MRDLRFFSQRPPWRELKFDEEQNCYLIPQYGRDKWLVSVIRPERKIIPHVKTSGQLLPLLWDKRSNGYIVPRRNEGAYGTALDEAINGRAGKLVLYDEQGEPLSPFLYIFSETISEEDYAAILDRLGQLAIAHESGVLAPVTVLRETEDTGAGESLLSGNAIEKLAQTVENNWESIKKYPAKAIKLDTRIMDLTSPQTTHSIRTVNRAAQKPYQRKQQILERQETYDSEENRFLVHVLKDILLPKLKLLAEYFRRRAAKVKMIQRKPDAHRHGQTYLRLWEERRVAIDQEAKRLEERASAIERIASKTDEHLSEPFLKDICANNSTLLRPSAKIAESKEYGPIYRAYQEYINNAKPYDKKSLTWALEEKSVRRTSSLYEIWVFFEIYARLIQDFGFSPDGDTPFAAVEVVDGEMTLQEGSDYRLIFTAKNMHSKVPLCTAVLSYSPRRRTPPCNSGKRCFNRTVCPSLPCFAKIRNGDWERLKPDITLVLQTGSLTKKFALDVKYRNYQNQEHMLQNERQLYQVNTVAEVDLLGTAKMKYLNGLDYDAAFVLHSDPKPEYTVFGEKPFVGTPLRERSLGLQEWWPAHKAGAIYIVPSYLTNLDKLLRCFLMYHAGMVSVCWNSSCHSILTAENEGMKKQPGYKGDYYQCPDCGEFWIGQICSGPQHHHLVKMGRDSFHEIAAQNEWNCVCPACGDQFKASFGHIGKLGR